ncbi:hypothetical protein F5Y10DRAFT_284805 [Nemania abortiva]|nr:hypothetical protein F5Y10DRAFT_284805 [Nemania abortiva]
MAESHPTKILSLHLGPSESRDINDMISKLDDFLQCGKKCEGEGTSTPPALPPVQAYEQVALPELQPVSLPAEIVLLIFECLDEYLHKPYKLRGCGIRHEVRPRLRAVFLSNPRLWADIPTFQICHATRSQAIRRYGNPKPDYLPFNVSIDSISFRLDADPLSAYSLPSICQEWDSEHNFFYYNVKGQSAIELIPAKKLSRAFLKEVQHVELKIEVIDISKMNHSSRSPSTLRPSLSLTRWLTRLQFLMKRVHKLRINLEQHDAYGEPWDQEIEYIMGENERYHGRAGIAVLKNFVSKLAVINSLEIIEIEKSNIRISS